MQPNSEDIERIVQIVLERLHGGTASASGGAVRSVDNLQSAALVFREQAAVGTDELVLTDSIVSLATVQDRLVGIRQVQVESRSIVTPAVLDLLRGKGIPLARGGKPGSRTSAHSEAESTGCEWLICGSAAWFSGLVRQVDARSVATENCADETAIGLLVDHLSREGSRAVWITPRPFAAATIANLRGTMAVHLPSLVDMDSALDQTSARVLVVGATTWTASAVGNLVRAWMRRS